MCILKISVEVILGSLHFLSRSFKVLKYLTVNLVVVELYQVDSHIHFV